MNQAEIASITRSRGRHLVFLVCAECLLVAMCATLLPDVRPSKGELGIPHIAFTLATMPADVRAMTADSSFPFALSITYCGAMILGLFTAISLGLRANENLIRQQSGQSNLGARKMFILALLLCMLFAPFLVELKVLEAQFSSGFFALVRTNRAALLVWGIGILITYLAAFYWCVVVVRQYLKRAF
jgi:hypothetical protein